MSHAASWLWKGHSLGQEEALNGLTTGPPYPKQVQARRYLRFKPVYLASAYRPATHFPSCRIGEQHFLLAGFHHTQFEGPARRIRNNLDRIGVDAPTSPELPTLSVTCRVLHRKLRSRARW